MAVDSLNDEIKKRRAADSLLNGSADDPDPDITDEEESESSAELPKVQTFDDYSRPSGPEMPKFYEGPPEEGGGRYVIDQDTGQKVPYAEPATEADKAAQPPGGIELPKVTVTGQPEVRRAELIDPDPDRQYFDEIANVPPAPDKLEQVERGELVKPPTGPAPGTLNQVERGELVTPPKAELVDPDPDRQYLIDAGLLPPDIKEVPLSTGVLPPKAEAVPVPPTQPPTAPPIQRADLVQPQTPPAVKRADLVSPQTPPAVKPAEPVTANPNGSDFPSRVQAVGDNDPAAFIVHHTSGRGTVDGVVSTLRERGLGVQYVMDRDGNIFQTGGPGAQNILKGWGKGEGLSNQNVVGMEIIAKDDKDVTRAQAQSFARFIAQRYPNTPLYGHGEVNPGHKEEDEGQTAKAAALAYRDQVASGTAQPGRPRFSGIQSFDDYTEKPQAVATGPVARAEPAGKLPSGFYKDEDPKSFVTGTVTTFGDEADRARYAQARAAGLSDAQARTIGDNGQGAAKLGGLYTPDTYGVAIPHEALIAQLGNNPAAWRKARVDVINTQTGQRMRVPIVDLGPGPGPQNQGVAADFTPNLAKVLGTNGKFAFKLVANAGPDVNKNPDLWGSEQSAIASGIDSSTIGRGKGALGINSRVVPDDELAGVGKRRTALIAQQGDLITKLPETNSGNVIGLYKRLDSPIEGVSVAYRSQAQKNLKAQVVQEMRAKYPEIKTDDEAFAKAMADPNVLDVSREWVGKALGFAQQFGLVVKQGAAGMDQSYVDNFLNHVMPGASDADKHAYLTKLYAMPPDQRNAEIASKLPSPLEGVATGTPRNTLLPYAEQVTTALQHLADPEFQKHKADEIGQFKAQMERNISSDPRLRGTFMERIVDATAQMPSAIAAFANPVAWPIAMAQVADQVREGFRHEHPEWDSKTLEQNTARATMVQFFGQEAANLVMAKGLGTLMGAIQSPAKRAIATALSGMVTQPAVAAATQAGANIITGQPIGKGVAEAAITGAIQGVIPGVVHGVGEFRRPPVRIQPEARTAEQPPVAEQPPPVTEPARPPIEPPRPAEEAAIPPKQSAVPITQEDVARRAYEIYEERVRNGEPGTAHDDYIQAQRELAQAKEPPPATVSEAEPINSAIANRYVQERMATGELGQIDPSQGKSTEDLVTQGLQMSPRQRDGLIDNFMKGKGGDLDQQGAAIRSREALLSEQARAASRAADADPTNPQLQVQAKAAADTVTAFHNGPIKKFKQVWSDSGRALQREIPLDYTTVNGMKEAYLKANNKEAPAGLESRLKRMAGVVSKTADAERAAMNNLGKEIENQTRGPLPTDDQVRTRLMEIMKNLPCPT